MIEHIPVSLINDSYQIKLHYFYTLNFLIIIYTFILNSLWFQYAHTVILLIDYDGIKIKEHFVKWTTLYIFIIYIVNLLDIFLRNFWTLNTLIYTIPDDRCNSNLFTSSIGPTNSISSVDSNCFQIYRAQPLTTKWPTD